MLGFDHREAGRFTSKNPCYQHLPVLSFSKEKHKFKAKEGSDFLEVVRNVGENKLSFGGR